MLLWLRRERVNGRPLRLPPKEEVKTEEEAVEEDVDGEAMDADDGCGW